MRNFGIVIHGGAGNILRETLPPALESQYRRKLSEAVSAGYALLEQGGNSLDAVIASIMVLEDSPLFNAGKGAVLNAAGACELDASVMNGRTLEAGAVAGLHHIRNPIRLARDIMEKSAHVMMVGDGAEIFARGLGYEIVPNEYFQTAFRQRQLAEAKRLEQERAQGPRPTPAGSERVTFVTVDDNHFLRETIFGTVGAAALDGQGNLAAGTSTGGMTNKQFGRVGDSPIIGAGTYADNATAAVSCTGHGEYFIRAGVAHAVCSLMEYQGLTLGEAAATAIRKVNKLGGTGGLIAIDAKGNVALPFSTAGMYRGYRTARQSEVIEIFGNAR
ncbi:MAG: isoaspartyl peptidase/L-asparaginase [Opitutaceae bacterium]|nr:isoaspartyl peptidase/L-asparaginase [Opitutaceae bacterium]